MCNMVRSHSGGSGAACISQQAIKLINCNSVSQQWSGLEACNSKSTSSWSEFLLTRRDIRAHKKNPRRVEQRSHHRGFWNGKNIRRIQSYEARNIVNWNIPTIRITFRAHSKIALYGPGRSHLHLLQVKSTQLNSSRSQYPQRFPKTHTCNPDHLTDQAQHNFLPSLPIFALTT